ncbi:hypothetical protein GUJ93_ZPchr0002g25026 [Zizania palustris]|uniref:Uncharacterized protein n=1 Tax=Zizania palustris TaxID=103762 RepID=A0A8J5RY53_ZIZPA|nr:hypothetical protein GUJ93_ZPchr0002g25026 [Zizania palustris]
MGIKSLSTEQGLHGEIFSGEPKWVQQWVDEQMVQGAFPAEVEQDEEPHVDHILDEPVEADAAWEGWPVQQATAPQVNHPQEAVSVQMSGVSNQPTNGSTTASVRGKAVHSPPADSSHKSLRP